MSFYQWQGQDLIVNVYVQPRASRDEIAGVHGDSLKVRITAPPVDGAANKHLCRFLGKCFGVSQSRVTLLSGTGARTKRLRIEAPTQMPDLLVPGSMSCSERL